MKPYYKKFIKFLYVSAEYESLPADVKPEIRRASIIKLDEAVAELVADDEMERLAEIAERTFVQRRPSRRQSVPWSCTNCIPLSPHLLCIKRTSRTALKHSACLPLLLSTSSLIHEKINIKRYYAFVFVDDISRKEKIESTSFHFYLTIYVSTTTIAQSIVR